jgi:SAM-dependent methyltransferase
MPSISLDSPNSFANLHNGSLEFVGWAYHPDGLKSITINVNDESTGEAIYGLSRPDVEEAIPGARFSGFYHSTPFVGDGDEAIISITATTLYEESSSVTKVVQVKRGTLARTRPLLFCPICESDRVQKTALQKLSYTAHRCLRCSAFYISPQPDLKELGEYYGKHYWVDHRERAIHQPFHYDAPFLAALIRKLAPQTREVVEIGCGPGLVLNGLRKEGFDTKGIEISEEAARVGREILDLNIQTGICRDHLSQCNCVLMRHMIEHSADPASEFSVVAEKLNPEGILVVITPNADSLAFNMLGDFWEWFIPPAHLFLFNPKSLDTLGARFGLELIHCSTRLGDGLPLHQLLPAIQSYGKFANDHKTGRNFSQMLAQNSSGSLITDYLEASGLGNEVLAVFKKPKLGAGH